MNSPVAAMLLALPFCLVLMAGCEPAPKAVTTAAAPPGPPLPPQATPPEAVAPQPQPATPETERVKAGQGVGIKGRSLDEHEGLVVTPAKTFFAAKERIAFEIAVPQAYALYKATADEVPADFADFDAKVLKPNNIVLPELPAGHVYIWDAEKQELQVERPKPVSTP